MAATQQEYYIRRASEEEARGPYTEPQLAAFAKAGQLDAQILVFEASTESWRPLREIPALVPLLLLAQKQAASSRAPEASRPSPAALGRQHSTILTLCLLLGSAAFPLVTALYAMATGGLGSLSLQPMTWFAAVDILLALGVLLGGTRIYLLVRLRAALGLGFLCTLFWLQDEPVALLGVSVASLALYFSTIFTSRRALVINTIAGLAGMVLIAYYFRLY